MKSMVPKRNKRHLKINVFNWIKNQIFELNFRSNKNLINSTCINRLLQDLMILIQNLIFYKIIDIYISNGIYRVLELHSSYSDKYFRSIEWSSSGLEIQKHQDSFYDNYRLITIFMFMINYNYKKWGMIGDQLE